MGIFDKVKAEAESMAGKAEEMMKRKKGDQASDQPVDQSSGQAGDQDAEEGQQPGPTDKAMRTAQDLINKQRGGEQDQAQDAGQQGGAGQNPA